MKSLIGQKHDEVYTDPATGKQCTANSCLSFANTIQEQAMGTTMPRTKQNLYNPEFTRTATQQGWVPVPLDQAKAGDRLQYWTTYESEDEGNARTNGLYVSEGSQQVDKNETAAHIADLGSQKLIANKFPYHMMVLSGGLTQQDQKGNYFGDIVQDGHEFKNADRDRKTNINAGNYVAYRYIGVNGQPTNNPAQAVAANPAAQKPLATGPMPPAPAMRAKGGLLPRPSQAARQDATAPGNLYRGGAPADQDAAESLVVRGMRKVLPINAAMLVQDLAGNKTPLNEKDLKGEEINILRHTARQALTKGREGISYEDYQGRPTNDIGFGGNESPIRSSRMATTIGQADMVKGQVK